jgi:hypothetical protein
MHFTGVNDGATTGSPLRTLERFLMLEDCLAPRDERARSTRSPGGGGAHAALGPGKSTGTAVVQAGLTIAANRVQMSSEPNAKPPRIRNAGRQSDAVSNTVTHPATSSGVGAFFRYRSWMGSVPGLQSVAVPGLVAVKVARDSQLGI